MGFTINRTSADGEPLAYEILFTDGPCTFDKLIKEILISKDFWGVFRYKNGNEYGHAMFKNGKLEDKLDTSVKKKTIKKASAYYPSKKNPTYIIFEIEL